MHRVPISYERNSKCVMSSAEYIQETFEELERIGKAYRFDTTVRPTKFMNATLNSEEVETVRKLFTERSINRSGRLAAIEDDGTLVFESGERQQLPWDGGELAETTFVHCSSGAFNFTASSGEIRPPVFASGTASGHKNTITVQEVFQYPGFCFNGSLIAKLECDACLSTSQKNEMCELPSPILPNDDEGHPSSSLGPSAGTITGLSRGHPLCVSMRNAMRWYQHGRGVAARPPFIQSEHERLLR